jgi:hypothetical protein
MGEGRFFQETSAPLSLMMTYRMSLISAVVILLDSIFKSEEVVTHAPQTGVERPRPILHRRRGPLLVSMNSAAGLKWNMLFACWLRQELITLQGQAWIISAKMPTDHSYHNHN